MRINIMVALWRAWIICLGRGFKSTRGKKMLNFDSLLNSATANNSRLKVLARWKYPLSSSSQVLPEIEYVCTLICLLYRCQELSNTEVIFHWYRRGRAHPPEKYTINIDASSSIHTCISEMSQIKDDNIPLTLAPQFLVYSSAVPLSQNSDQLDMHTLYLTEGMAYCDFNKKTPSINFFEHFNRLIEQLSLDPGKKFSSCNMLTAEEIDSLLYKFGNDYSEVAAYSNIHSHVELVSEENPESTALLSDHGNMTFKELNGLANQLAYVLLRRLGDNSAIIAVDVMRSPNMIVAFLAILKAGYGYLPIDGSAPDARVHYMIRDCACRLIITDKKKTDLNEVEQLVWDDCVELMATMPEENLRLNIDGETIAYVNYTSGSTGTPKGVEVRHKGVVRLNSKPNFITFDSVTRMLQLSNVAFDAATFEIWGALMNACPLVLYNGTSPTIKGLMRHVEQFGANTAFITTSLFNLLADEAPEIFDRLRYVIFGGEKASIKHVCQIRNQFPHLSLVQAYGPTECTTFSTTFKIDTLGKHDTVIPIGKPIKETQVYILDAHGHMAPVGVHGEMYVGGSGVARGYRNQGQKTELSFVRLDRIVPKGGIHYRTGDIAYRQDSGDIVFVGRRDDQVKIRGYRIELGEITDALSRHPKIAQLFTTVIGDNYDEKRIVVYVVPKNNASISISEVRAYGAKILPKYMAPSEIVIVSSLPLNANGKLDKKRVDDHRIQLD